MNSNIKNKYKFTILDKFTILLGSIIYTSIVYMTAKGWIIAFGSILLTIVFSIIIGFVLIYLNIMIRNAKQEGNYFSLIFILFIFIMFSFFSFTGSINALFTANNKNIIIENQLKQNKILLLELDKDKLLIDDKSKIDSSIVLINNTIIENYQNSEDVFNFTKDIYNEIIIRNQEALGEKILFNKITFSAEQIGKFGYTYKYIDKNELIIYSTIFIILILIIPITLILFTPRVRKSSEWWNTKSNKADDSLENNLINQ